MPAGKREHHIVPSEMINPASASFYLYKPDPSRKAYATVGLSWHPHGAGFTFEPGDEVQDILPADVLDACVERGEVSYTKPKAA